MSDDYLALEASYRRVAELVRSMTPDDFAVARYEIAELLALAAEFFAKLASDAK